MPQFLHEASTSGSNPIDSSVALTIAAGGQISMPSGANIARASISSEVQVIPASGLFVVASGEGQWSMISGVAA